MAVMHMMQTDQLSMYITLPAIIRYLQAQPTSLHVHLAQ